MRSDVDRATARDRPPEEAAEDTSFARGLRLLLTIADRGEIRADELRCFWTRRVDGLSLSPDAGRVRVHRAPGAGYRLAPRLIIAGGANVTAEELIRTAGPVLQLLADETGETAVIVRRLGPGAVCLHEIPSQHAPPRDAPAGHGAAARPRRARQGAPRVRLRRDPRRGPRPRPDRDADPVDPDRLRPTSPRSSTSGVAPLRRRSDSGAVEIAVPIFREDGIVGGDRGRRSGDPLWRRMADAGRASAARRGQLDRRRARARNFRSQNSRDPGSPDLSI